MTQPNPIGFLPPPGSSQDPVIQKLNDLGSDMRVVKLALTSHDASIRAIQDTLSAHDKVTATLSKSLDWIVSDQTKILAAVTVIATALSTAIHVVMQAWGH